MEVTTRPYWKDRNRQHVDIMFPHPHTQQPFRKRIVAPVGMDAVAATEWGREQAMHLFKKLCKVPTDVDAQDKEDKPATKTRPAKAPRLMEVWDTFINEHVLPLKHASHAGYYGSWQNHIKDALGMMRLDEIDAIALNQFRSALEKKGHGVLTQKQNVSRVRTCLKWAVALGRVKMEIPKIEYPKRKKVRKEVFSKDQWELLHEVAENQRERVLALLLTDGVLRIGETAGLMWSDVRFDEGIIRIQRNVCKGRLQSSPKGEDGDVPLTPRLASALLKLKAESDGNPFVLGRTKDGVFMHGSDGAEQARTFRMQEDAGIPKLGPHRVRHSVLTFLAENGVQPYELQALARHADAATTNRYYVHINRRKLARQAVRTLAGLISPEPTPPALTTLLGNDVATAGNKPQIRIVA
jgi:integrase